MPNEDLQHQLVIRVLQKAGWLIVTEHYYVPIDKEHKGKNRVYIDLQVQNSLGNMLFIEVKGLASSLTHSFMEMLGQYQFYRVSLVLQDDPTPLYVAISQNDYRDMLELEAVPILLQRTPINFMIYDDQTEEILEWIPSLSNTI